MESFQLARRASLMDTRDAIQVAPSVFVMGRPWLAMMIFTLAGFTMTMMRITNGEGRSRETKKQRGKYATLESRGKFITVRLGPGEEIVTSLTAIGADIPAAAIVSCVGSLTNTKLRLSMAAPGMPGEPLMATSPHEIVSLVGTLGRNGKHLHASVADDTGKVWGGHLLSATVHTTAEVVLVILDDVEFERVQDDVTGYRELRVVNT